MVRASHRHPTQAQPRCEDLGAGILCPARGILFPALFFRGAIHHPANKRGKTPSVSTGRCGAPPALRPAPKTPAGSSRRTKIFIDLAVTATTGESSSPPQHLFQETGKPQKEKTKTTDNPEEWRSRPERPGAPRSSARIPFKKQAKKNQQKRTTRKVTR